jgi:regulator of cell morphogenesis and NO signaling
MNHSSKIGEIIAFAPSAIGVFEQLGIDCYRVAGRPLHEFCSGRGVSSQSLLDRVKDAEAAACADRLQRNWVELPLSSLIEHIVQRHHQFTRDILSEMHRRSEAFCERHRRTQPEIARLQKHLRLLERELTMHLRKEEETVFPHIRALEDGPQSEPSTSIFFASVRRPVGALMSVMADEHDLTDKLLERLREASLNLDVLQVSFGNFPELVQSLKRDLLVHSCLEDFILFPRAGVLEESQCAP